MSELVKRALAGTVFVTVIVLATISSMIAISALLSIFIYLACSELGKILGMNERELNSLQICSIISYVLLISPLFFPAKELLYLPFAVFSACLIALAMVKQWDIIFGVIYLTIPLALLSFLGSPDYQFIDGKWQEQMTFNTDLILAFFILIWSNDTFAYLCGRALGKHALAPNISPKKTWEGFFGGLSFTILAAVILGHTMELEYWLIIPIAAIISVFGTIGDLLESYLKRQANLKDSGSLIPGHGGILDRIDGILIAAPVVVSYAYIYQ